MNLFFLCALLINSTFPTAQIISDNNNSTTIQFILPEYSIENKTIDNIDYNRVILPGAVTYLQKGYPELPRLFQNIIINDIGEYQYRIISGIYETLAVRTILPSKGNLSRTINPDDIPYEFDNFYTQDQWFPDSPVDITKPYIIRDYRGLTIHFNPFQFNPLRNELIVCKTATVEIYRVNNGGINIKTRNENTISVTKEFENLYQDFFLNFSPSRYDTVLERAGRMLVISANQYYNSILPFVTWKRMKGIPTKLIRYPDSTGTGYAAVKTYIQNEYNRGGLVWVLIVGDAEDVPPAMTIGISITDIADPVYSYLDGGDYYPDAFISRFSANSTADVDNQVQRTITYERTLITGGDWERKAMGVASNLNGGTPYHDSTRMNWIRNMLLGYNYTSVDRIYDPTGTIAMVSAGINEGRSFVNYIGHGSTTGWGSTGFSSTNVNQLTNTNKLPFIISVACINGNFDGGTCFAEAWLRAGSALNPTGAIAFYGSSVNQDWVPPTVGQSAACSLLVQNRNNTVGGIMFNGSCHMIAAYLPATDGVKEFETWHIFGDASVPVRTLPPQPMTVVHQPTFYIGLNSINVSVPGVQDALVGIYKDTLLYGSGYTDASGNIQIIFSQPVTTFGYMHITVTAYNKATYFDSIPVVPSTYPYIIASTTIVNDSNANGQLNPGEIIQYGIWAKNVGIGTASNVRGYLRTTDPYVTFINDSSMYGNIPANDSAISNPYYRFRIAANCPNNHPINLRIEYHDINDSIFNSYKTVTVYAPQLTYQSVQVVGGNNNGILNRGETVDLVVNVKNEGGASADNISGILTTTSPNITINDAIGTFGNIAPNNIGNNAGNPFTVFADSAIIPGTIVQFRVVITSGIYTCTLQFSLPVEIYIADFEANNGEYVPTPATGGWEWGSATAGPSSAHSGNNLWGTVLSGMYPNSANFKLESPELTASADAPQLKFWHWYNMENTYDGGNLKISTNNGGTWTLITPEGGYPGRVGTTNAGIPGESCYTNINENWNEAVFNLPVTSGQRFLLRWCFGSDGSVQRNGWYIDDVTGIGFAALPPPNNDVGIDAMILPSVMHRVNTVMQPTARIKNYGVLNQTNFPVICSIFGTGNELRYSNTQTVATLASGDTTAVIFAGWTPTITEMCNVKMRTSLPGDQVPGNDLMQRTTEISLMFLAEGFNDAVFPPNGWQRIIIQGTYGWERTVSNTYPTCTPFEGEAMASFRSFSASSGSSARLISPAISLGSTPISCSLKFFMYHDPGYTTSPDSIKVEYSMDGTNFTRVDAFRRYEATSAWIEHQVYLGTFSNTIYIGLLAYSGYGNNMNIDYIRMVAATSAVEEDKPANQIITALYAPKPNPVTNGLARITYSIAEPSRVTLKIYDASGRIIKTLVNGQTERGIYNLVWNGKDENNRSVAEGIYFYTLDTPSQSFTKKMVFTK